MEKDSIRVMARNREARHEYFIEEEYEAGIELFGTCSFSIPNSCRKKSL